MLVSRHLKSSSESIMFPFGLSLFDTALLVTIIVFMLLYLIVLVKLKPSTEGEKALKKESVKQNVRETFPPEQRDNSVIYYETREEPVERVEAIERPKPVSKVPVETEKTEFSQATQSSGCPHHFGYLKQHPKKTPIPNECLTCTKIMECLVGVE